LWCLGNEMDGPWQLGGKTAQEYGRLAAETAKAMKLVDSRVQLVLCGSSSSSMPTFGNWEATVLEHAYDYVDYLSLHSYYDPTDGDRDSFLASAVDMDRFIEAVVATCDHVGATLKKDRKLRLSYDEWNVWYQGDFTEPENWPWRRAPELIENHYTVADAVVVGNCLISLLNHADRVGVACLAQLVNVIAPIRTEAGGSAWAQTIFHPFALTAANAGSTVLQSRLHTPSYSTRKYGEVGTIDCAATIDEDGRIAVFAVNRGREPMDLTIQLRGLEEMQVRGHTSLAQDQEMETDPHAAVLQQHGSARIAYDQLQVNLPAVSWNVINLNAEQ
jgi:alpha-L-arabinofuranosidase